jgi:hypothetical protein
MKTLAKILGVSALLMLGLNTVKAQSQSPTVDEQVTKSDEVKTIVTSKNYIFEDEHTKTPDIKYRLRVSPDTVMANLPAHGNTNAGSVNDSSMQFMTSDFAYNCVNDAKGGWIVTIKPNGTTSSNDKYIHLLTLHINSKGYASLSVRTSSGTLTYAGYIKQRGY